MVIIWGSKLYGKVDQIPGLCYVATKFGHLWYLPLIPMGTYAVFSEDGDEWQGAELPFSFKSFVIAWLRTLLVVAAIGSGIAGISVGAVGWIACAIACVATFVTYKIPAIVHGSYRRAVQIASIVGVSEEVQVLIDVQYGRMDPDEAEARLEKLCVEREAEEAEAEARRAARRAEREAKQEAKRAARAAKKPVGTTGALRAKKVERENGLRAKAPKRRKRVLS